MNVMGLDVGTTGCKAIVFNEKGTIKGYAFCEYGIHSPRPGIAEQDALDVYAKCLDVMKSAVGQSGESALEAISLSVQGDAIIPIDGSGAPLYAALLGMDYRSDEECKQVEAALGARWVFEKTGMPIHPINSFVKMLWFKNKMPELYEKTWKFMTYGDFMVFRLAGEPLIDLTMASRTMAMDIESQQWDDTILDAFGFDKNKLSTIGLSGSNAGKLSGEMASLIGVCNRPAVVLGGHDQPCGALGAGVVKQGMAVDSMGTAEVLSTVFEKPVTSPAMMQGFYPCYSHVVPNLYFTFALNHTSGILLRWFRDELCGGEVEAAAQKGMDFYEYIQQGIGNVPSNVLILPHFNGAGTPSCDMGSMGAIAGLTLSTTKKDIFKAFLDSLTYELLINIQTLSDASISIDSLRAVGGGAKSPLWLQLKADITGREIATLETTEAGCLGAAMLAATGTGMFRDVFEAVDAMTRVKKVYVPNKEHYNLYQEKYTIYRNMHPALQSIHTQLSKRGK